MTKVWRRTARASCSQPRNYQGILQGFFAGEGNVKDIAAHHSRVLRIAQGKRLPLLERILRHFCVTFRYDPSGRSYEVSGRENLEKLWRLGISRLHSKKQARFAAMMSSYRQYHYRRKFLRPVVLNILSSPLTATEIANGVTRSKSRVNQLLTALRRNGEVEMFKVRSSYYWIRSDQQCLIISEQKSKILKSLSSPRRTFEIAQLVGRTEKTVSRRLAELSRLGLVERVNSNWRALEVSKRVIVK